MADNSLKLNSLLVNPVDFTKELIIFEVQSSKEIMVTGSTRKGTSKFLVQEVGARRVNAVERHNRKERIRRKDLNESLKKLRKQLRKPTRKLSTITILRAAQEEIRELNAVQEKGIERLDSLKKQQSHLQWKLEELKDNIKKLPQNLEILCTSLPKVSLPASSSSSFRLSPSSVSQASLLMGHGLLILPHRPLSPGFLNVASVPSPVTPPTHPLVSLYPHNTRGILPYPFFLPAPSHLCLPTHVQPSSVQDNFRLHPLLTSTFLPRFPNSYVSPPSLPLSSMVQPQ